MKPSCFVAALAALAVALPASADFVAPNTVPTSGVLGTIFRADGARQYQEYIASSQFASLTKPIVVTGLQVSLPTAWPPNNLTFQSYIIQIGTASAALTAANGVFSPAVPYAANMVNPVTVYSGSLTLPTNAFNPGVSNPVIQFNTANYTIHPGDNVVIYISHSISDQPTTAQASFATTDQAADPTAASAVFSRDNTSTGWGSGNGDVAPPYLINFVTDPRLVNLSTRATVETGAAILIGGFIIEGNAPKKIIVRAIGPSLGLPPFNLPNVLVNPQLTLFDANNQIASNDDWQTNSAADIQTIQDAMLAPADPRESAIVQTLAPGAYTAQVSGVSNTQGNALLEVFDVDSSSVATAVNISTRAKVETGNNVVIAGFIVEGNAATILMRGIGGSLGAPPFNIPGALADPTLELHNEAGAVIATNDNWQQNANAAAITATGLAPTQAAESAILMTLPAGAYTCILRGVGSGTGIGRIDVYNNP